MSDDDKRGILDIADRSVCRQRSERADPVGQLVRRVLQAADPDLEFTELARSYIGNQGQDPRRACIMLLAKAFGCDRVELKKYLRAKGVVNQMD